MDGFDTEHNPDLQYVSAFLATLGTGILPDGTRANTPAIDPDDLEDVWNAQILDTSITSTGTSRGIRTPNDFFMDQFGSQGNRAPLLLLQRSLNQIKGRVFGDGVDIEDEDHFTDNLEAVARSGQQEDYLLANIRETIAVFRYINHPNALPRIQANRRRLREVTAIIEREVPVLAGMHDLHIEFDNAWYRERSANARTWVADRLVQIIATYSNLEQAGTSPANAREVRAAVDSLFDDLPYMEPPPEDPNDV
ncbi:hypothetical protein S7711_02657 [Stachybotrys chartarum IBT 7711]|uniref:Uncharacterized protein n=1 Tax=Stachybotrys chartarum (strain CBS 109288 / IBT 7711) TaxID=1280523 RepID=A0A084B939_STACB|nr:hypothetical protein S7711_02657 [Stachybotrys chartarum IBT 7711]KFA48819.1 hypothetical protein S40293_01489 [Stachybotrys chartarum IBT 40293]KFA80548.1 hypothetical protein S40288_07213 [Stachybotrys chartarum IBT 40288]